MNADLNEVADSLMGIRFAQLGRRVQDGLDCLGCLIVFYERAYGIQLPEHIHEGWFETKNPKPGDVAQIAFYQSRFVDHCAILLPGDYLLHSVQGAGVVRSRRRLYHKRITRWLTRDRTPSTSANSSPGTA